MNASDFLLKPDSYANASDEEKAKVCNGCGAKGWTSWLVPDTMYGLDVEEACNIHDWMYEEAEDEQERAFADFAFWYNMTVIILCADSNWIVTVLRLLRAHKYFRAVRKFGLRHCNGEKRNG